MAEKGGSTPVDPPKDPPKPAPTPTPTYINKARVASLDAGATPRPKQGVMAGPRNAGVSPSVKVKGAPGHLGASFKAGTEAN